MQTELVTRRDQAEGLFEAWEALWLRTPGSRWSLHPLESMTAWDSTVSDPVVRRRTQPAILVTRRAGALVGVLPLQIKRALAPVLSPLGFGTRFSLALIAPEEDAATITNAMLDHLGSAFRGSIIQLPYLLDDTAFGRAVLARKGVAARYRAPAAQIHWGDENDWDRFLASKVSNKHLSNYRRRSRQLSALGEIQFGEPADMARRLEALDWMFRTKAESLREAGVKLDSELEAHELGHLRTEMGRLGPTFGPRIHCLTLDGAFIAASLSNVGNGISEGMITTYHKAYREYSIGRLLMERVLKFSFDQRVDVDLRHGQEDWKKDWFNSTSKVYRADMLTGYAVFLAPFYRHIPRALSWGRWRLGQLIERVEGRKKTS